MSSAMEIAAKDLRELIAAAASPQSAIDALKAETVTQIFNVKTGYGAKGDGVADDTAAIKSAIDAAIAAGGGVVFFPTGTYLISSALSLPSNVSFVGSGMGSTTIKTSVNTINAIEIAENARKIVISDISIISDQGIGTSNAGIKCNDINGGAEHLYRNINITSFYYGLKTKEIWWNNTVENVRWNTCQYSFFNDGTGGQCINNLFIRCYSNEPISTGYRIGAFKNTTWLSCNNGGAPNGISRYVQLFSPGSSLKFIGCNFENINLPADGGGVQIWSSNQVTFDSCTFVANALDTSQTGTAYEIETRDTSEVFIVNCKVISQGTNMKDVYIINSSKVSFLHSPTLSDNYTSFSSVAPIKMDEILNQARQFTPKATGVSTVDRATFINPGTGVLSEKISVTLIGTEGVTANIKDILSDGSFKVEFFNIADGTLNTVTHKVFWAVY